MFIYDNCVEILRVASIALGCEKCGNILSLIYVWSKVKHKGLDLTIVKGSTGALHV